jgi:hypothetical protein
MQQQRNLARTAVPRITACPQHFALNHDTAASCASGMRRSETPYSLKLVDALTDPMVLVVSVRIAGRNLVTTVSLRLRHL